MKKLLAHFLIPAAAVTYLAACAPVSPNLDKDFGSSLAAIKAAQTLNPAASANTANPTMDGVAAKETHDRYVKSYAAPTPHQNVFTIGVGSGSQ